MAAGEDGRVPSLGQLQETVVSFLKSIPLFADVSRRLIDDLVTNVGIARAMPNGVAPEIHGREPVVLLVLERPVVLRLPSQPPIRLLQGAYLRGHPLFGGAAVTQHAWAQSVIRSADGDRSRVFLFDRDTLLRLPQIVRNALDHDELKELLGALSPM